MSVRFHWSLSQVGDKFRGANAPADMKGLLVPVPLMSGPQIGHCALRTAHAEVVAYSCEHPCAQRRIGASLQVEAAIVPYVRGIADGVVVEPACEDGLRRRRGR